MQTQHLPPLSTFGKKCKQVKQRSFPWLSNWNRETSMYHLPKCLPVIQQLPLKATCQIQQYWIPQRVKIISYCNWTRYTSRGNNYIPVLLYFNKVSPYVLKHSLFSQGLTPYTRAPVRHMHLLSTNTFFHFAVGCLLWICWTGLITNQVMPLPSSAISLVTKNFCYPSEAWLLQGLHTFHSSLTWNRSE